MNKNYTKEDINLINELIGTNIELAKGKCFVDSLYKGFVYIIYEDDKYGKDEMKRVNFFIEEYLRVKKALENKALSKLQKLIEEKGFFNYQGDYIANVRKSMFGNKDNGCNTDNRKISFSLNSIDWEFDIKINANGFGYCHTLVEDENSPFGLFLKDGSEIIELDKVDWYKKEELYDKLLLDFEKEFDDATKMDKSKDVYFADVNKKDVLFTFWQNGVERAWRFRKNNKENDLLDNSFIFDVGYIHPKNNTAQNGRRPSWGCKFTLPKNNIKISYNEVKEKIMEHIKNHIKQTLEYTTEEKIKIVNNKIK